MPLDKSKPLVLTPAQVAEQFAVTTEAVRMWAERGKLRGFRTPGGQWRFRVEDVEAFTAGEPEMDGAA